MNDHEAIRALIFAYVKAVDRADFEAVGALFEHGVLQSPRGEAHGAAAVTEWYRAVRVYDDGTPQTWHHVFGLEIDVDGDAATAHSYVTAIQHRRPIVSATYDDTFERVGGVWRFARRTVSMDLVGDLTGHLEMPGT